MIMRVHKSGVKRELPAPQPVCWRDIADFAEQEIARAEARISRLRRAVRIARAKDEAGEPFPVEVGR